MSSNDQQVLANPLFNLGVMPGSVLGCEHSNEDRLFSYICIDDIEQGLGDVSDYEIDQAIDAQYLMEVINIYQLCGDEDVFVLAKKHLSFNADLSDHSIDMVDKMLSLDDVYRCVRGNKVAWSELMRAYRDIGFNTRYDDGEFEVYEPDVQQYVLRTRSLEPLGFEEVLPGMSTAPSLSALYKNLLNEQWFSQTNSEGKKLTEISHGDLSNFVSLAVIGSECQKPEFSPKLA